MITVVVLGFVLMVAACSMLLNRVPQAAFLASPSQGVAPLDVTFDASASHDSDGQLTEYRWALGDGTEGRGVRLVHRYAVPGTYTVRLTVEDDVGSARSSEQEVVVRPATNFAIIIGIAAYYYAPCLYFVDDDALAIRQALLSSPSWDEENVVLLLNSEATTWNLAAALEDLDSADEGDLLFVFFSGHGGRIPDEGYGEESDGYDEVLYLYNSAWISDDALERYLAGVPMRNVVVMVDSCFSGGQLGTETELVPASGWATDWAADLTGRSPNRPQDLDALSKRIVAVTASRETEYSWEVGALEHGVFTYALLEAINGAADAAGNRNGAVSAEECYAYVAPRVQELLLPIGEEEHPQMLDLCEGELEFLELPAR